MGLSVTAKILKEHLVSGELTPGTEIGIRIDQTLTQDATGTMAYLQFEAMGFDRVKNELAVSYVDHNTVQVGPENAADHAYLQSVAAKYGIIFSKPGNGICHQVHLERFGMPGKTLLGSDSHTPTGGGIGMIAMGAGGVDVAVAMGGGPYYLSAPEIVQINLTGRLKPWSNGKDVALKILEVFGVSGNVGCVFEYGGAGVETLDVTDRATITNMGAECGVTASVFPSDEQTKKFLEAQGRGDQWVELKADDDADYARTVEIDLSSIEPMAAAPDSPGNIRTVASLAGKRVDQVLIGSCTNSSYKDLKMVCRLLEDKKVAEGVSLGVAPGSRQVLMMMSDEKLTSTLLKAGARLLESACGFCIGNSQSPKEDAVSLRTSNRNFKGRSGTKSAKVFLVSPEVAALAAIEGRFVDPLLMPDLKCPQVKMPSSFTVDDSMLMFPPKDRASVEIVRGPTIGDPPANDPLPDELSGTVAAKVGDDITTDHIMPAGPRLKHRSNIPMYSTFVFENVVEDFADKASKTRDEGIHNVIVAGKSYGQGSSREHAALCPMYLGVKAVIAVSIERIHAANLINFGIVPFLFDKAGDYERVQAGDGLTLPSLRDVIAGDGKAVIKDAASNADIAVHVKLSDRQKEILLAGGLVNYVAKNGKKKGKRS